MLIRAPSALKKTKCDNVHWYSYLHHCKAYLRSFHVRDRMVKCCKQQSLHLKSKVVLKPTFRLSCLFPFKDKLPLPLKTSVVYKFQCGGCKAIYYGKTAVNLLKFRLVYKCPDGSKPIKAHGAVLRCLATTCRHDLKLIGHTCPAGAFCVFPSYQNLDGFCCPEKAWCPAGTPLPGKDCRDPKSENERCPPETHHCFSGPRGTSCCPLPCPRYSPGQN